MDATTELGPLIGISRDALTECFDLFEGMERALEALPYRVAVEQLGNIGTVREHLANLFPGGLAGACEYCGELIGYDEIGASDRENGGHACKACVAKDPAHFPGGRDDLEANDGSLPAESAPISAREAVDLITSGRGDEVFLSVRRTLRDEAARLLEASLAADTTDEAIELRMDAARSSEAADRADAAGPDADGWITWAAPVFAEVDTLPRLVTKDTPVDIRMGDGTEFSNTPAGLWLWHSLPDASLVITAYRLRPEAAAAFPVPGPEGGPGPIADAEF